MQLNSKSPNFKCLKFKISYFSKIKKHPENFRISVSPVYNRNLNHKFSSFRNSQIFAASLFIERDYIPNFP